MRSTLGAGKSKNPSPQAGFVLLATLWIIVIILVLAAGFDAYISNQLQHAATLRQRIQSQTDQLNTEQALRYLLTTQRQTIAGVTLHYEKAEQYTNDEGLVSLAPVGGELRLDGTVYQGFGNTLFSLQDESGLIPLNSASSNGLRMLLKNLGAEPRQIDQLVDQLQDYWDQDDFRRLNGAEKWEYINQRKGLPANDYLRGSNELTKVLGWSEWLQQNPAFDYRNWLTDDRVSAINFNTIPQALLIHLLGPVLANPQAFIEAREQIPFREIAEVERYLTGSVALSEEEYRFFPGNRIRLRLWSKGGRQSLIIGLELSALDLLNPVQERYRYTVSHNNVAEQQAHPGAQIFFQRFITVSSE